MVNLIKMVFNHGLSKEVDVEIIPDKNICFIEGIKYNINNDFVDKIMDILITWDYEYGYSNILDSEEFRIDVIYDNGKSSYHGKGVFPSNYDLLLNTLGDVVNE